MIYGNSEEFEKKKKEQVYRKLGDKMIVSGKTKYKDAIMIILCRDYLSITT